MGSFHRPGGVSCFPIWGGAPRATDGSYVLEVMNCKGEGGAAGKAHHSCSSAPKRFRPSGSSGLVEGATLGTALLRSISIMDRSQAGSSVLATFQSGNSLKLNRSGSRLPFSPSAQTTQPLHCSSCHTCNWCRWPQAFLLGRPLVMMPMCFLLDKGGMGHGIIHSDIGIWPVDTFVGLQYQLSACLCQHGQADLVGMHPHSC